MLKSKRIVRGWLCQEERGVTYLLVMLAVVLMGISASVAAKQWKAVVQREREAELLARGIEIQTALWAYSAQQQKGRVGFSGEIYPLTLEELTKQPKPALRKAYKDPITGDVWEYVRDPTGRIKGVRSKSKAEPFKQKDFPPVVRHFDGLTSYNDWVFQHPNASTPQVPAAQAPPPQPTTPGQPTPQTPGIPGLRTPPPGSTSPPPPFPFGTTGNPAAPPPQIPSAPGGSAIP
jgi:type II secretory pathway pseudopilin PulG